MNGKMAKGFVKRFSKKAIRPNGRVCHMDTNFFIALTQIHEGLQDWEGSINIIRRFQKKRVLKHCEEIISRIGNQYSIDVEVFNGFIDFISLNPDIFPHEYFYTYETEAGELGIKCNLRGYDHLSKPFQMYHHNKMLDARFNMNTGELTIKCNIIGETGYTKKFKGFVKPGNGENGLDHVNRLVDIIANIMLLCSLCYIRGDYDAIEKCFVELK